MTIPIPRAHQLDLGFVRRGDRTVLDRRLFNWPFVLTRTFALDAAPSHMLTAIVQTSSGALHGEDQVSQRIDVASGAAAQVTSQGATSVHRARTGQTTRDFVTLRVAADGHLDYMPEPRILFPDAALEQTIELDCQPGATVIIADGFTLHDPDGADRVFRSLKSSLTIRQDSGRPLMIDRQHITGDTIFGQRGRRFSAFGGMVMLLPRPAETLETFCGELNGVLSGMTGVYGAASLLPEAIGIGIRLATADLAALRAAQQATWISARVLTHGARPSLRRVDGQDLAARTAALAAFARTV